MDIRKVTLVRPALFFFGVLFFCRPSAAQEDTLLFPAIQNEQAKTNSSKLYPQIVITERASSAKAGPLMTANGDYSGMSLPYVLANPEKIPYPKRALRAGWSGQVILAIEILIDGTVGRYQVMKSAGHKILDEAAAGAVRKWKFYPAVKNGRPIVTCIEVPVNFELNPAR